MTGFMNIINTISTDPRAWIVLALFGARALWSVFSYARCPLATRKAKITQAEAQTAINARTIHSWRFLLTMLGGITLAIVGLFKLAHGEAPPALALFFLILGVYLFTTEPVRHQITDAENHVTAAAGTPGEKVAISNLRDVHVRLVSMEIAIVGLLLFGMVAI